MYAIKAHWGQYVSNELQCNDTKSEFHFTLDEYKAKKFLTKDAAQAILDESESGDIDIVGDFEVVSIKEDE